MDLSAVEAFVRTGETRSFTATAQQMGLTASGVSKAIARLEESVGVKLLHRSTRSVGLTADGATFYERCRQVLADLKDAELALSQAALTPRGRLKVTMPVTLGQLVIVPGLARLGRLYPELEIEASVTDRHVDLVEEGFDAAIRIADLPDSGLIARRLCGVRWTVCGSPDYLAERGPPTNPSDLARHDRVVFVSPQTRRSMDWNFAEDGAIASVRASEGARFFVDNGAALVDAALAGAGLIYIHSYIVGEHVAAGRLKPVLEPFAASGPDIHLVYPPSRHLSPKVRAFADLAIEIVPADPPWDASWREAVAARRVGRG